MGHKISKLNPRNLRELKIAVHEEFTDDEIKEWYEEFSKGLKKGATCLSTADFISVYNKLFRGDATAFAEQVFRVFDTNHNNQVDFKEFMTGLYVSGSSNLEVKYKWAFTMYDLDEDGFISKDEMIYMLESVCKMTESHLPEEYNSPKDLTDAIFEKLDKDHNNLLSLDEFMEGANKIELIVDLLECDPHPDEKNT